MVLQGRAFDCQKPQCHNDDMLQGEGRGRGGNMGITGSERWGNRGQEHEWDHGRNRVREVGQ